MIPEEFAQNPGSTLCSGVGPHQTSELLLVPNPSSKASGKATATLIAHDELDASLNISAAWNVVWSWDGTTLVLQQVIEKQALFVHPTIVSAGGLASPPVPVAIAINGLPCLAIEFYGNPGVTFDVDVAYRLIRVGGT